MPLPRCWSLPLMALTLLGLPLLLLAQGPAGKRYALLVGINRYRNDRLRPLDYAEADASELAQLLRQAGYEVTLLTGSAKADDQLPTKSNIERQLHRVLRQCRDKDDMALVALAGHGLQFEPQDEKDKPECYFCPVDARPFRDETDSLVSLSRVYSELQKSHAAMKVLLVDACRDDPDANRGMRGVDADSAPRPPVGVAALFSCRAGERAYEHERLGHGVFFHYALEGLRGKAKDSDEEVTFAGLAAYVSRRVSKEVPRLVGGGARQSPHLKADYSTEPVLIGGGADARVEPERAVAPFSAAKARALQKAWADYLGKKVIEEVDLGYGVTMELVLIPPGTFVMGSPADEEEHRDNEGPAHEVELTQPFWMGKFEVTRGQFRRFVDAEDYKTEAETDGRGGDKYVPENKNFYSSAGKEYNWRHTGFTQSDDHPVTNVTWNDAMSFCRWVSRKAYGKIRLPTEAQWEYCCRAGTITRFYSGDADTSLRQVANIADLSLKPRWAHATSLDKEFDKIIADWFAEVSWDDSYPFTAPVGQFRPNAFGLYDMHGNACEWCADWFGEYADGRLRDPEGPAAGSGRVFRGGGATSTPRHCRSARRDSLPATRLFLPLGFRVVLMR